MFYIYYYLVYYLYYFYENYMKNEERKEEEEELEPEPDTEKEEKEIQENHEEQQYLDLIRHIMDHGFYEKGRNGNTYSVFGYTMRFQLQNGRIPILTTKQVAIKTCFKELMWFLSGSTDNEILNSQGVHIWDGNSTPEFMQSRGLSHYRKGLLGPIYGFQWRSFNAEYDPMTGNVYSIYPGIDQIQQIIDQLRNPETRNSRRLLLTAWNPCALDEMALPPCHVLAQFNVHQDKYLSCSLYQRSGDVGLGVPFNIASYSLLTILIAHHCGLEPYEFIYFLGNAHIYENHIEPLKEQIERVPYSFPRIQINGGIQEKIEDYTWNNIEFISKYQYHPSIKMEMVA